MSAGFVRVATDSTGKRLQTFENIVGADDVHAEAVVLVDADGVSFDDTNRLSVKNKAEVDPASIGESGLKIMLAGGRADESPDPRYYALPLTDGGVTLKVSGDASQDPVAIDGIVSVFGTANTKEVRSGTATTSQVADTASNATLLASNANRLGATIQNDSSAVLYVKLGTTASATDYTVRLVQYSYFELPYGYTGRIDGIWATDPNDGAARITELT